MAKVRITSDGTRYFDVNELRRSKKVQATLESVSVGFPRLDRPGGKGSLVAKKTRVAEKK